MTLQERLKGKNVTQVARVAGYSVTIVQRCGQGQPTSAFAQQCIAEALDILDKDPTRGRCAAGQSSAACIRPGDQVMEPLLCGLWCAGIAAALCWVAVAAWLGHTVAAIAILFVIVALVYIVREE